MWGIDCIPISVDYRVTLHSLTHPKASYNTCIECTYLEVEINCQPAVEKSWNIPGNDQTNLNHKTAYCKSRTRVGNILYFLEMNSQKREVYMRRKKQDKPFTFFSGNLLPRVKHTMHPYKHKICTSKCSEMLLGFSMQNLRSIQNVYESSCSNKWLQWRN